MVTEQLCNIKLSLLDSPRFSSSRPVFACEMCHIATSMKEVAVPPAHLEILSIVTKPAISFGQTSVMSELLLPRIFFYPTETDQSRFWPPAVVNPAPADYATTHHPQYVSSLSVIAPPSITS